MDMNNKRFKLLLVLAVILTTIFATNITAYAATVSEEEKIFISALTTYANGADVSSTSTYGTSSTYGEAYRVATGLDNFDDAFRTVKSSSNAMLNYLVLAAYTQDPSGASNATYISMYSNLLTKMGFAATTASLDFTNKFTSYKSSVGDSSIGSSVNNAEVAEMIGGGFNPDMQTANWLMTYPNRLIGILLGLGLSIFGGFLSVQTILDVIYISQSVFRSIWDGIFGTDKGSAASAGSYGGGGSINKAATLSKSIGYSLISAEARGSLNSGGDAASRGDAGSNNVILTYFKKRMLVMLPAGVLIILIATNNFTSLFTIGASAVVDMLSKLGQAITTLK